MTHYAVNLTPFGWEVEIDGETVGRTFGTHAKALRYVAERLAASALNVAQFAE